MRIYQRIGQDNGTSTGGQREGRVGERMKK
jgi:hypothetical protein